MTHPCQDLALHLCNFSSPNLQHRSWKGNLVPHLWLLHLHLIVPSPTGSKARQCSFSLSHTSSDTRHCLLCKEFYLCSFLFTLLSLLWLQIQRECAEFECVHWSLNWWKFSQSPKEFCAHTSKCSILILLVARQTFAHDFSVPILVSKYCLLEIENGK